MSADTRVLGQPQEKRRQRPGHAQATGQGTACAPSCMTTRETPIALSVETDPGPPVRVVFAIRDRGSRRGLTLSMRSRAAAGVAALLSAAVGQEDRTDAEVEVRGVLEFSWR